MSSTSSLGNNSNNPKNNNNKMMMMKKKKDYQLRISRMWIGMAVIMASLTSFLTGCAFRAFVLVRTTTSNTERSSIDMPPPVLDTSKQMPYTMYTEKQYDVAKSIRNSHHLHIISTPEGTTTSTGEQTTKECDAAQSTMTTSNNNNDDEDDEDEEEHLPAGQHLLVDIKNVDSHFLDSEQRLAQAMVDIVNFSKLTMLSYHCHSLLPSGVSCVGVLLESHISFHTWPKEGVITLDLFTCGSGLLIPLMPIIEQYFAIPQPFAGTYRQNNNNNNNKEEQPLTEQDYIHKPKVIWKHTLRGFRPRLASNGFRPLESDVGELSEDFGILYKKEVNHTHSIIICIYIMHIHSCHDGLFVSFFFFETLYSIELSSHSIFFSLYIYRWLVGCLFVGGIG